MVIAIGILEETIVLRYFCTADLTQLKVMDMNNK